MFNDWADNIGIFYANLSWFYLASMFVSCLAVALSSWGQSLFYKKNKKKQLQNMVEDSLDNSNETTEHSLQTQYKLARQKLAEQHLTDEQRSKEKEAEAQQLAAILKLLQEQKDTFQVSSMDQLQNQLRLYRN